MAVKHGILCVYDEKGGFALSGQMLAFFVSIGMLLLVAAAAVLVVALKRDRLLFPMLLGACACFVGQYLLFDLAYGAAMRLLTENGVSDALIVQIPIGIAFVALYETLLFLVVLGLGFRKHLRRRDAAAFGTGYWCFLALATAAGQLSDLLATKSILFTGSELEILATGLQLPLELPLYIALSVMAAQLLLFGEPRYLFYALFVNMLFRLILATPQLFGVAMLVALGVLAMMSLLLVYYIVRSRGDAPELDENEGAENAKEGADGADEPDGGSGGSDSDEDEAVVGESEESAGDDSADEDDEGANDIEDIMEDEARGGSKS